MKKNKKSSIQKSQEQQRNEKFSIISNRIAYYYKEVFNVEIVSLLYKKEVAERIQKMRNVQPDKLRGATFDFYILIKDNNRIFKYKLIKVDFNISKYVENEWCDFIDILYELVDDKIGAYCQHRYMNDKVSRDKIQKFLEKDREINDDYNRWKIENYK